MDHSQQDTPSQQSYQQFSQQSSQQRNQHRRQRPLPPLDSKTVDSIEIRSHGSTRTSPLDVDQASIPKKMGLGINFYDSEGQQKKETLNNDHKAAAQLQEAFERKFASPRALSLSTKIPRTPSSSLLNSVIAPSPSVFPSPNVEVYSVEKSLVVIDELLQSAYKGQALSLTRPSSSSRVRSVSNASNHTPFHKSGTATASYETPTSSSARIPSLASQQRADPRRVQSSPLFIDKKPVFEPYRISSPAANSPATYGHRILTAVPILHPRVPKRSRPTVTSAAQDQETQKRSSFLYFTPAERQAIADLVHAEPSVCKHPHTNCTDCLNLEFAFHENKAMPTSMPPDERQRIINNNRSLRNIKNVSSSLQSAI